MARGRETKWTPAADATLRAMWPDLANTVEAIGDRLGGSASWVRRRARDLGLPERPRGGNRAREQRQTGWGPVEIDRMLAMARDGKSAREIGLALGRTKSAVIGQMHRQGVNRSAPAYRLAKSQSQIERAKRAAAKAAGSATGGGKAAPGAGEWAAGGRMGRPPVPDAASPPPASPAGDALARLRAERRRAHYDALPLSRTPCAWIEGDPLAPDHRVCGAPAVAGKPYCRAHCCRAYRIVGKGEAHPEAGQGFRALYGLPGRIGVLRGAVGE